MYYSLVHFPEINGSKINYFRQKYDPYLIIDPHFTLIFPIPDTIDKEKLIKHIQKVIKTQKPFCIHISGLEKSWDNWLFLVLKEGKSEMIRIHDKLYTGVLQKFLRKDIEYIPHIAIGLFTKKGAGYDLKNPEHVSFDELTYKKAFREARLSNFDYISMVNKLSLVEVDDDFTKTSVVTEFELK